MKLKLNNKYLSLSMKIVDAKSAAFVVKLCVELIH